MIGAGTRTTLTALDNTPDVQPAGERAQLRAGLTVIETTSDKSGDSTPKPGLPFGACRSAHLLPPLSARTRTLHRPIGPAAYDCVRIVVVRDGTAIVFSEFGQRPVSFGDAILLGRDRAGLIMPWLDEMVALSADGKFHERFHRLQALWFAVVDVMVPFIRISPVRLTPLQRARARPIESHGRRLAPVRREAMLMRDALHRNIAHPWTRTELAELVHLSPKQLTRLFVEAFGKTPTAYLTMLRVQEMARLLRETNITVTAAGQRVGWRSRSRAVEAFAAHTGVTPNRYRNMRPFVSDMP